MGYLQASAMAAYADLDTALHWHLTANHYPPLPAELAPVARLVIEKAQRGEWDARVRLPPGTTYQGKSLAPVRACVEARHLDAFIRDAEEEEDDDV